MDLLVDGVDFAEGPRWRDGELWYSDFYQRSIYALRTDGTRRAVFSGLPDQPSGLGWMPDGSLLVVAMTKQKLWREVDGELRDYADLSGVATAKCNDMVVAADGTAYVGNFGFDLEGGGKPAEAKLARVAPDGTVSVAAEGLRFPNGSVITPDGSTLIVGETMRADYVAFDIDADGSLTNRRVWAEVPNMFPDGCCLDSEGAIWFADALGSQLVRVKEGGEIVATVATPMPTYACMLGGDDGRTLFALCAPGSHPDDVAGKAQGAIYATEVAVGRAGLP
ncbi:MAG TPA: SMP-30/gluconolactonase/LRE family protein [Acidimicrobiales bacterium]|nr:SMP-30/gluconolactonase/LRE family protein [Acidimicrobiales bacterium]